MRKLLAFGVSTFALVAACSGAKEDGLTTGSPSSSSGTASSSGTSGTSGTSGSSGTSGTSGEVDGGGGDFKLTAQVSSQNTCAGGDISPAMTWTGVPADTKSFAVVLVDTTTGNYRWAIADIPSTLLALPPNVQKVHMPLNVPGAKQALVGQQTYGYKGPCPPKGETHNYQLTPHALSTGNLPGFNQQMSAQDAEAAIKRNALANSFITAKWTTN